MNPGPTVPSACLSVVMPCDKKIGWCDGIRAVFCIVAYSPVGAKLRVKRLEPLVVMLTGTDV